MSQRTTGKATAPAMSSDRTRLAQKRNSPNPASIAPGITNITALSTISIIIIDTVSEAKASRSAARNATPDRSNGNMVSRYPNTKASAVASAIVLALSKLADVPMTTPSTSPIEQPVKQWAVAANASLFNDS
jgi:hypothetical protein